MDRLAVSDWVCRVIPMHDLKHDEYLKDACELRFHKCCDDVVFSTGIGTVDAFTSKADTIAGSLILSSRIRPLCDAEFFFHLKRLVRNTALNSREPLMEMISPLYPEGRIRGFKYTRQHGFYFPLHYWNLFRDINPGHWVYEAEFEGFQTPIPDKIEDRYPSLISSYMPQADELQVHWRRFKRLHERKEVASLQKLAEGPHRLNRPTDNPVRD